MAVPLVLAGVSLAYFLGSSDEAGSEPAQCNAPRSEPLPLNPLTQRAAENAIPGRYDNLPMLQSVYSDPATMADPGVIGQMNYAGQAAAETYMERQMTLLEPGVTPLGLGVLPQMSRGSGVQLPDPISGDDLKPQKRENRDIDMFMPMGQPLQGRDNQHYLNGVQRAEDFESKRQGGHGALDSYTFQPDLPGAQSLGNPNAVRNFANGEVMTGRSHPRTRIFRQPETYRGRNEHAFRLGNPTFATGKLGSIYQTESAPLGEMQMARNADVAEYWREPREAGGAYTGPAGRSAVDMGVVNRDMGPCDGAACEQSTQRCWTGPGGRTGIAQEARRILCRYTRPKYQVDAEIAGPPDASHGVTQGSYQVSDYAQDLCENAPQRLTMEENVVKQPAPHNPRGNNAAYSYFRNIRHTNALQSVPGREPGPVRAVNGVADAESKERFYNVDPRSTIQKQTGLNMEAIHAPNETRSMAMQRPEQYYESASRRVTPFVEVAPAYQDTQPYRSNPYTQPLPAVPATDFF